MAAQIASRILTAMLILGITSTSWACNMEDISSCFDQLSDIELNEIQDACNAITSAKGCMQVLLDSGSCSAEITQTIENYQGTVDTLEQYCNMATDNGAIECTLNGIFECVKPTQEARKRNVDKATLCSVWAFTEPCLEAIEESCANRKMIQKAVHTARSALGAVAQLC